MHVQWYLIPVLFRKIAIVMFLAVCVAAVMLLSACGDDQPTAPAPLTTVTDIDGNVYDIVTIGNQVWMAQNLKVTHYRTGDPLPNVTDPGAWQNLSTGAYCEHGNDAGNVAVYGRLYNWYAIHDGREIAPAGWHVPSDDEWKQLEMFLGMSQIDADTIGLRGTDEGGKLKEVDTTHWRSPNTGATDESGFTGLPGGCRDSDGGFLDLYECALLWSSSEFDDVRGWYRVMWFDESYIGRERYDKESGFSVRCVRD